MYPVCGPTCPYGTFRAPPFLCGSLLCSAALSGSHSPGVFHKSSGGPPASRASPANTVRKRFVPVIAPPNQILLPRCADAVCRMSCVCVQFRRFSCKITPTFLSAVRSLGSSGPPHKVSAYSHALPCRDDGRSCSPPRCLGCVVPPFCLGGCMNSKHLPEWLRLTASFSPMNAKKPSFRRAFSTSCGGEPEALRLRASAHFGDDAVHGMVHGDTQLVDTLPHLRFHGVPAVGHHHPNCRAGHQSGADTDPKSGTHSHISHSFSAWP